ncbi:L,D-transpeptidase [Microvirga arsenatis]|uniref:L,D-transpeptidase family protein n=1 Tax=Microvirga arsenatis TaxID=2692265 RepID=A0ABW9YU40_9HYPH|nr:L,D-transpeptidase [Microvirga arsenatis]NBJ09458.1 L,D-transpeptidase family protein [Microvirga arsenatis]NBJ23684.1 L,D-transpeptidase family protein [Microvirga arsenatis]
MRLVGLLVASLLGTLTLGAGWAKADVLITVDKTTQHMSVSVGGKPRYAWSVSTGKAGYETPVGTFTPSRLVKDHASKEWDNSPMPHSIFFTHRGHAIHGSNATRTLGRPASHGCVRLAPSNAAKLFALVRSEGLGNTKIVIRGDEPKKSSARTVTQERPKARNAEPSSVGAGYSDRRPQRPEALRPAPAYGYASPLNTQAIFDWQ